MNVSHLKELLELQAGDGYRLNPQQAALIEQSLVILQRDMQFQHIYWWGYITGCEATYFIAFGYRKNVVFNKKYFYSLNCSDWYLLPPANPELFEVCQWSHEGFQGDPTHVQTFEDGVLVKEEDRLACVVEAITEESGLVPRGAFYRRSDQEIVQNPCFRGIEKLDALSFTSYQLSRPPRNELNNNLLKRQDYNYRTDFFDTLDDILPVNRSFSLRKDPNKRIVYVRSLHWPGMVFIHQLDTPLYGFRYLGDGVKNRDILFMVA